MPLLEIKQMICEPIAGADTNSSSAPSSPNPQQYRGFTEELIDTGGIKGIGPVSFAEIRETLKIQADFPGAEAFPGPDERGSRIRMSDGTTVYVRETYVDLKERLRKLGAPIGDLPEGQLSSTAFSGPSNPKKYSPGLYPLELTPKN